MLTDVFLALGLALSPATQLRIAAIPLGPGEVCLLIWLALTVPAKLATGGFALTNAAKHLLAFWAMFAVALAIGYVTAAVLNDKQDPKLVLHDVIAYPLLAAVSIAASADPEAKQRLWRVAWLCAGAGTVCLLLQGLGAAHIVNMLAPDPWYWERLRGWSQNPNQLAFFCLFLLYLALHLLGQSATAAGRFAALVCLLAAACTGYLTQSDALRIAFAAGAMAFLAVRVHAIWHHPGGDLTLTPALAWYGVLVLPLAVLASVLLLPEASTSLNGSLASLAKNGGVDAASEAQLRYELWQEALDRGIESGFLGLGPGPHLPIPASISDARQLENEPDNLDHPQLNGTANFEAHNTFLDLLTQGGLLAVASFVWLILTDLQRTVRKNLAGMAALLVSLCVFAITGFVARQPVFWFAIAFSLVCADTVTFRLAGQPTTATWPRNAVNGLVRPHLSTNGGLI